MRIRLNRQFFSGVAMMILFSFLLDCGGKNNPAPTPPTPPTVTSMTPNKANRGQLHISATIQGANLSGVLSVDLGEHVTVESFHSSSAASLDVVFSVATQAGPGLRDVTVTTAAGTGTAPLLTISTNLVPVAKFTVSPKTGPDNTVFTFDATDSADDGRIASYDWQFGDQQSGHGEIVTHQFSSPGNYDVTLTVTDTHQSSSSQVSSVVVVEGVAPVADFSFDPSSGNVDTVFHFDASGSSDADGEIVEYQWNFGDGTGTGKTVDHRFKDGGLFKVNLTVVDNDGFSSTRERELLIEKFDESGAIEQIRGTISVFFDRFSELDKLSADQILVGWSDSPGCKGRLEEKKIIEREQLLVTDNTATILGSIPVLIHDNHFTANADATARFDWTETDGSTHSGIATHHFQMLLENDEWLICNFTVDGKAGTLPSIISR